MRTEGFEYRVSIGVVLSGRDIFLLGKMSDGHYDLACRSASSQGGILWGFANQLCMNGPKLVLDADSISEDVAKLTIYLNMTSRDFDGLCKICEVREMLCPADAKVEAAALFMQFKQAKAKVEAERERINAAGAIFLAWV